ncbi:MAG: CAP domain-containing protein [Crocinitomicaceae bacterium]|nr:CAP domain-containing protein [Flavobacteriales bacterium]NQZ36951.1 CAP domain-containing protein [Crocinitomicaceae bacterium]
MKKAIIFLLLVLPFMAQSNDMFFSRLEKLNNKDQKKCLEVAKRYIKIFPENASAYYFSSIIYNDRADKSRSTSGKYRNLKRAISHAITFEQKDDGTIASNVNWSDYTAELTERAYIIADKLEEENEERYSTALLANLDKLDKTIEIRLDDITLVETKTESDVVKLSPISAEVNSNNKMEYFGLPRGNEMITSASLTGERDVLKLINEARVNKGMSELEWDEDLANAARYHAYDLATQDYFDHASFDRSGEKLVQVGGTFDRIKKFYSKSFVNSENIAAGNKSPQATYQQWFNSPGHHDNMFNAASKKVGLGVVYDEDSTFGYYWVFCTAM